MSTMGMAYIFWKAFGRHMINNKKRDSFIALLTQTLTAFQDISRMIHW